MVGTGDKQQQEDSSTEIEKWRRYHATTRSISISRAMCEAVISSNSGGGEYGQVSATFVIRVLEAVSCFDPNLLSEGT